MSQTVQTGLERALEHVPFQDARVGLVTHRAAVTGEGVPGRRALLERGARIVRLFSPEHGLESAAREGVPVADATDALTGLPVISLFGGRRQPIPEDLEGLEGLVVDLQDVGARCYTYLSTMILVMEAATAARLPVWVLDRPNPITGQHAEGICRRPGFESFVGHLPIPMRHGLTFGELASWARPPGLDLHVVTMQGWRRGMWWDCTGLPWVRPSPAIPDADTALAYPGTVLLEGTDWSDGRGTPHPFVVVAGPENPIEIGWEDRDRFRPVAEGIRLLQRLCERDGPRWRGNGRTLDILFGSDALRVTLEAGESVEPLVEDAAREGAAFATATEAHRLYG